MGLKTIASTFIKRVNRHSMDLTRRYFQNLNNGVTNTFISNTGMNPEELAGYFSMIYRLPILIPASVSHAVLVIISSMLIYRLHKNEKTRNTVIVSETFKPIDAAVMLSSI